MGAGYRGRRDRGDAVSLRPFLGASGLSQQAQSPPQVYQQRTRPCPAMEYLSSPHFPEEYQDNLLVGNVIGFQGIMRYKIEPDGELQRDRA